MEERDILLMAALIASVRTARFEPREFEGMASPRMMSAVANSLFLARLICERAEYSRQSFLDAQAAAKR